jgi:hypothetical protein
MLVILLYKAAPCAHTRAQVRIRALFHSPLKLVLQIVRKQEVGNKYIPFDYVFSCPCNKEPPRTHEPLQRGE